MKFAVATTAVITLFSLVTALTTRIKEPSLYALTLPAPFVVEAFAIHRITCKVFGLAFKVRPPIPSISKAFQAQVRKKVLKSIPKTLRLANPRMVKLIKKGPFTDFYSKFYGDQLPYHLLAAFLPELFAGLNRGRCPEYLIMYSEEQLEASIRMTLVKVATALNAQFNETNHPFAVLINKAAQRQRLAISVGDWLVESAGHASLNNPSDFGRLMDIIFEKHEGDRKALISAMVNAVAQAPFNLNITKLKAKLLRKASELTANGVGKALLTPIMGLI